MTSPPDGADVLSVTVPSEVVPPTTAVGLNESPTNRIGLMVRVAVVELVPKPAVI